MPSKSAMMHKLILKLVALLNPFWRSLKVDPDQLQAILEAKLLYDARRPRKNMGGQQKEYKEWAVLAIMAFFGLLFAGMLFLFSRTDSSLLVYFLIWLVYMVMILLTDFTEILIDVRDNYIILPQPVNDRTVTLARLLHIVIYLGRIAIAFSFGAILYFFIAKGWWGGFIFLLLLPLATVLVVFGVNILYLLLLRVSTPSRFKDYIGYFQIAFTTLMITGYYILPKLLDFDQMLDKDLMSHPLADFIPSAWLGSLYVLLAEGQNDTSTLFRAAMAVVVPMIGVYTVVRLSTDFNKKLMMIGQGGGRKKNEKKQVKTQRAGVIGLRQKLARFVTSNNLEKASFEWVWIMMRRSRDFKIRTYPTLGFIPAMFIYFAINSDEVGLSAKLSGLAESHQYILLLYFCIYALMIPQMQSNYSEQHAASWIFQANPLHQKGSVQSGRLLAIIFGLYIPIFLLVSIFVVGFWGVHTLDDIFTSACNSILAGTLLALYEYQLPFSEKMGKTQRGGNFALILVFMMGAGVLGVSHYFLATTFLSVLVIPLGLFTLLLLVLSIRSIRKRVK